MSYAIHMSFIEIRWAVQFTIVFKSFSLASPDISWEQHTSNTRSKSR